MSKKCETCKKRPAMVNYTLNERVYYRKTCYRCAKAAKLAAENGKTLLKRSGYKKKLVCDRCGFKARLPEQIDVYYRDGDRQNVSPANLRSHCANCMAELKVNPAAGKNDLLADF